MDEEIGEYKKCHYCKKKFYIPIYSRACYAYKKHKKIRRGVFNYYCSYSCMRAEEKEEESKYEY